MIVKSAKEMAAVVAGIPFSVEESERSRFLVAFAQETQALANLAVIASLIAPTERFAIGSHAAYLHCPGGSLKSKAGEALLGRMGRGATTRNLATTLKLHLMMCSG